MPDCMVLAPDPISASGPPDSDCRCIREPTIIGALTLIAPPNILGANPLRARRDLVAESLLQSTLALRLDAERAAGESVRLPTYFLTSVEGVARESARWTSEGGLVGESACLPSDGEVYSRTCSRAL